MASTPKQVVDPTSLEQALGGLQERINQLQSSLAQQQKLATLGMITAVIAHEFNNILTPMIGYTRSALGEKSDEALRQKALEKALAGAERAANISKSLLGFARGDDSKVVQIKPAIQETLACLSRDLSKDAIALEINVPDELTAAMNAGQFQQVLMNLIVNARSAMLTQRGLRKLCISATLVKRQRVQITVADTGPGIPAEVLGQIFEPFFSTKKAGTLEHSDELPRGGTGLGLTICRDLIDAAGGTIRAENRATGGAAFMLELPGSSS